MVSKHGWQLCDQGHDLIICDMEGYEFWAMILELLFKVNMVSRIALATTGYQMQFDHVRWDEPVNSLRFEIKNNIKSV
jgi:hypothetical protein